MEDEERNVAQRLRRKHIRTLELLQATTKERDDLRKKIESLCAGSDKASPPQSRNAKDIVDHNHLVGKLKDRISSLEASRQAYEGEARDLDRRLMQAREQLRNEQNRSARLIQECQRLKETMEATASCPAPSEGRTIAFSEHEAMLQAAAKKTKRLEFLVSELKKRLELAQDENLRLVNSALENANKLAKSEAAHKDLAKTPGVQQSLENTMDEGRQLQDGGLFRTSKEGHSQSSKNTGGTETEKPDASRRAKAVEEMKALQTLCAARSSEIEGLKLQMDELRTDIKCREEAFAKASVQHNDDLVSYKAELAKTRERMLMECARADSCEQKLDAARRASKAKEGKIESRGDGKNIRFAQHVELKKENARLRAKVNDLMSSQKRMLKAGMRAPRVRY